MLLAETALNKVSVLFYPFLTETRFLRVLLEHNGTFAYS